jgi:hypothetical protein
MSDNPRDEIRDAMRRYPSSPGRTRAALDGVTVYTAMPWGAGASTWATPEEALGAFGDAVTR